MFPSRLVATGSRCAARCACRAGLQQQQQRTLAASAQLCAREKAAFDTLNVQRLARKRQNYDRRRLVFLAAGSVAGVIATIYTALQLKHVLEEKTAKKLDAGPGSSAAAAGSSLAARKVIVHDKDGHEVVPTGDPTVTTFPRTLQLAEPDAAGTTEYTLVGLGVRTVSFLSLRVYVVGYYIATADISALQNRLVKRVDPIATTLVPSERDELRTALLDPTESYDIWNGLLKENIPTRTLFRIMPVRDTDFHHLRDGLVRAIQARAPRIIDEEHAADGDKAQKAPEFRESVREMRRLFDRGKAQKATELILWRGEAGRFSLYYDDGRPIGRQYIGSVDDERLTRALWLNYLGGSKVASELARRSIVDGLLEFVERPIGTVATQVI